jgi:hypothetical protein
MARAKQASKRKRPKIALPVWGAAGMSLAMAGGASAGVATTEKASPQRTALPSVVTLGEEELADVSLSTFFVFDRENTAASRLSDKIQLAQRCRGCRGCAVARCGGRCAVARCAVRRCGVGCGVGCAVVACARCTCSCCLSWGACQLC